MHAKFGGYLAAVFATVLAVPCTLVQAAEVKVLSTIAFQRVFEEQVAVFNRSSGHTVKADFGGTTAMATRVRNGEAADVYFGTRQAIDALAADGKIRPDSVVSLANSPVGFAVKKGAPWPDVSTAAKLKSAILASKGITYPDPASGSPSANHLVKVAEQLGVADVLKAKTRRPPGGAAAGPGMLNTGEADLAFQQNCELLLAPNVELIGPLPREFQLITVMAAAVPMQAREPEAALAFIRYLQTPAAAAVMSRWGLEPLTQTGATELKVLSTIAFETALHELLPQFAATGKNHVNSEYGITGLLARRLEAGEPADVFVGTRAVIDELVKSGKMRKDTVVDIANSTVDVAVRKGAPRPDISTAEKLKKTLLAAKGISYTDPATGGASGVHFAKVIRTLGIAEQMKSKTHYPPPAKAFAAALLSTGMVDLAIQQRAELLTEPNIELLGPLPQEFQSVTLFSAAVPVAAQRPEAGKALIKYLASPSGAAVLKAKGLEPLAN